MAAYHQYHAVDRALRSTVEAASAEGDRRAGVVWHTQGSGKSMTMAYKEGTVGLIVDARGRPLLFADDPEVQRQRMKSWLWEMNISDIDVQRKLLNLERWVKLW